MTTRVGALNQQQQGELWTGAGVGGLIGSFIGRPILGALGGLLYKLLSNDGLREGANKLIGNVTGIEDPLGRLGGVLGVEPPSATTSSSSTRKPLHRERAEAEAASAGEERKSGMPTWAKVGLGIAGAVIGTNVIEGALSCFGLPFFGGFGMGFPMGMPGMATSGNYYMDQMMLAGRQMMPFWMG